MKSDFAERRAARVERYQDSAAKAEKEGTAAYNQAKSMAACIPFGQPILVGHHSEGRDRNFRAKIGTKFEKAFTLSKKAEHYAARAESAASNTAISSDDPEAVVKLREKIEQAEAHHAMMKAANKLLKAKTLDRAALNAIGLADDMIDHLLKPDFCGRIGYADYSITNSGANIRTMKKRLEYLQAQNEKESTEETINGIRIFNNTDENRVQMFFPGKPAEEVRKALKSSGFRWSPTQGAWQRQCSNSALWSAQKIAGEV
jgi:hypothetical protein